MLYHQLDTIIIQVYFFTITTRKDVKGDWPSGGETTWTNSGGTRSGSSDYANLDVA